MAPPIRSTASGIKLRLWRRKQAPCQSMAIAHNPSMNRASFPVLLLAFGLASLQASAAPSAEAVLNKAKDQAAKDGKKIFLAFDASW
jgi:hypothetical protein